MLQEYYGLYSWAPTEILTTLLFINKESLEITLADGIQ